MKVKELMSKNPATCEKTSSLKDCAKAMVDFDCGMIPVIEKNGRSRVVGAITDRDITCRAVAKGKNPLDLKVGDVMTSKAICINQNASDEEAERLMEKNQIRRLIVVDDDDNCIGVLAQADIARHESASDTGKLVSAISKEKSSKRARPK